MESQKVQEMSKESLLKQKVTIQAVTGALAGLLTLLLVVALYLWSVQGPSVALPLLVVPLALSPILFINVKSIRDTKKELQARNEVL